MKNVRLHERMINFYLYLKKKTVYANGAVHLPTPQKGNRYEKKGRGGQIIETFAPLGHGQEIGLFTTNN